MSSVRNANNLLDGYVRTRIKFICESKGLTIAEASRMNGRNPTYLPGIVNSKRSITLAVVCSAAERLGVTVFDLLGIDTNSPLTMVPPGYVTLARWARKHHVRMPVAHNMLWNNNLKTSIAVAGHWYVSADEKPPYTPKVKKRAPLGFRDVPTWCRINNLRVERARCNIMPRAAGLLARMPEKVVLQDGYYFIRLDVRPEEIFNDKQLKRYRIQPADSRGGTIEDCG